MKKIALFIAAVAFMAAAQAQVVVSLQGGYYQQNSTTTLNDDYSTSSMWFGGLRVGYNITQKLSIHVAGTFIGKNSENLIAFDSINYHGQDIQIYDHKFKADRSGWEVTPELEYEFLKYGNMHFGISLYGTIRQMGYTTHMESFYTVGWPNAGEYHEAFEPYDQDAVEPYVEQVKDISLFVGVRPTISYEFSKHFSAELTLDFLSLGYAVDKTTNVEEDWTTKTTAFYAGFNTVGTGYEWETPAFRLGFNWTF